MNTTVPCRLVSPLASTATLAGAPVRSTVVSRTHSGASSQHLQLAAHRQAAGCLSYLAAWTCTPLCYASCAPCRLLSMLLCSASCASSMLAGAVASLATSTTVGRLAAARLLPCPSPTGWLLLSSLLRPAASAGTFCTCTLPAAPPVNLQAAQACMLEPHLTRCEPNACQKLGSASAGLQLAA